MALAGVMDIPDQVERSVLECCDGAKVYPHKSGLKSAFEKALGPRAQRYLSDDRYELLVSPEDIDFVQD